MYILLLVGVCSQIDMGPFYNTKEGIPLEVHPERPVTHCASVDKCKGHIFAMNLTGTDTKHRYLCLLSMYVNEPIVIFTRPNCDQTGDLIYN